MDFLALVKRLATETGVELESKIDSVDIPPALAYGQSTENRTRLVRWIQEAWIDIQEDQDSWNFMLDRVQIDIAKSQYEYDIATLVDTKKGATVYDYLIPFTASIDHRYIWIVDGGSSPVTRNKCYFEPPERFFGDSDRYNNVSFGIPGMYTIDHNGCLHFNASPSHDNYYIEFLFKQLPTELTTDTDVPGTLKAKHHMVIVYAAMVFYAGFDETDKQFKRAFRLYKNKMNKLRLNELKDYSLAGTRT